MSATDHGIATRAFRPDAQAAARGAGHAATFATTEHFNLQVSRAITVPVLAGRPALGTWQSVVLVDTNVDNPDRDVRLSFLPA